LNIGAVLGKLLKPSV